VRLALLATLALAACTSERSTKGELNRDAVECVSDNGADVRVPDVRGELLAEAIQIVEEAGLRVVANGVPEGDPVDEAARVRAQEPPAGEQVSFGACVGFRTER
jgi:beta-lactam-binding protein with PASTA domain